MNEILVAAFLVALIHTAIPSHWLCFVLVGRARGWRVRRTMAVAGAAGALHVATTVTLGVLLARAGQDAQSLEFLERFGGWVLIGIGVLYFVLHFSHKGHHHDHEASATDRVALGGLVLAVTFSPCSVAIPILIGASAASTGQVIMISCVLFATTVGNMMMLTGLTALGVEKLPFSFFDRYEKVILGLILAAAGTFLVAHPHDESRSHGLPVKAASAPSAPQFPSAT